MTRIALVLSLACAAGAAHAHSNIPSPATFTNPPRLSFVATDGGELAYAPYAFPTADATYDVSWDDGDLDPTGRHYFYYLDHAPPLALGIVDILAQATPIPEASAGIWASCSCPADFGMCPDAGVRDCRNGFTWDTHLLEDGAYFLIAVTRDPPYDVYTVSDGPVRVSHGAGLGPPPGVIVVRPDGFGTFDKTYKVRWLQAVTPPFKVDLSYAADDDVRAGATFLPLAADLMPTPGPDGSYGFDWDVSALASARLYHVRASVRDAAGESAFTISRAGLTVFHPGDKPDLASHAGDLGGPGGNDDGCGCAVGGGRQRPTPTIVALACVLLVLALRRRTRA